MIKSKELNEYLAKLDKEEKERSAFIIDTLKSLGIQMSVHGCGCCGSPDIKFTYKGQTIEGDHFNFDTEK